MADSTAVKNRCSFPWPSLSTTGLLSLSGYFPILTSRTWTQSNTGTPLLQMGTPQETHSATLAWEHPCPHRPKRDSPRLRGHLCELWLLITEFHGKDTSWCRELAWVWEALCLPLLPQTPCKHTLCDTVSFMCQLSWAVGWPGYLVKFYSGCFCEGGFG